MMGMPSAPRIPDPPPLPPPPALPIDAQVLERRRRTRRNRRGSEQTLLTGPQGIVQPARLNIPTLLGGGITGGATI